jgi:YidC/Oxa1 family membrane protein insertase
MNHQKDQMHPEDQRNMVLFAIAAVIVYFFYNHIFIEPRIEAMHRAEMQAKAMEESGAIDVTAVKKPRGEVLAQSERIHFGNNTVWGTIALTGGRIDDLQLLKYNKTLNSKDKVDLLSPSESDFPLYIEFGWLGDQGAAIALPDAKTVWKVAGRNGAVQPGNPVTLFWENGEGLRFERDIALDDRYMFTITQRVINKSQKPVTLYSYGRIIQQGLPDETSGRRPFEGAIGDLDNDLIEIAYPKMMKNFERREVMAASGWIGITEEYWFTSLIPAQGKQVKYAFSHVDPPTPKGRHHFQVDEVEPALFIAPGASAESATKLFTGAKEVNTLESYESAQSIPHFDLAVDFGLFYFMTKPLFHALDFFYRKVGNMGIAIIMLTCLVRVFVFPLATTSYRSFAGMRKLAPQMKEVREKYANDQVQLQKEMVKLYEKEKVNPMAGCLPMIVQIPIFFALYKVMVINIELRHAPFFGWIHDLSASDPTTVFNLFGLIPWHPPLQLMIGAWPLMMLGVQLLQRNMNPPAQDKMQAAMINFMPFFFCYIMSQFAAGLVVYWTFSGGLSVLQQYIIMRSMGVEVRFFRRPDVERELEKQVKEQPAIHPGLAVLEDEVEEALGREKPANDDASDTPKKKKKK